MFRIQLPSSRERHAQMGIILVTQFECVLGDTIVFFCRLCTNPLGYKLGCHRSHSTPNSSLISKIPGRNFQWSNCRFCSFFGSRVIHTLLENSQHEQTIAKLQLLPVLLIHHFLAIMLIIILIMIESVLFIAALSSSHPLFLLVRYYWLVHVNL